MFLCQGFTIDTSSNSVKINLLAQGIPFKLLLANQKVESLRKKCFFAKGVTIDITLKSRGINQ